MLLKCLNKKNLAVLIAGFILISQLSAYELSFKLIPSLFLPNTLVKPLSDRVSEINKDFFEPVAFGATFDAGFVFDNTFEVGPEFGFYYMSKANSNEDMKKEGFSTYILGFPIGFSASYSFYPVSRIQFTAGLTAGISFLIQKSTDIDATILFNPYYRMYVQGAFRINPNLNIIADVSLQDYQYNSFFKNPMAAGISFGAGIQYKIDSKKSTGSVTGTLEQDEPVFPLFYTVYKSNPVGTITITNDETSEIRNVIVKFRAGDYTASEMLCGTIPLIKKHKSEQISLYADFSDVILQFSEEGKTILLVSSEMKEVIGLCDKIVVLSEKQQAGTLEDPNDFTQENILELATKFS